MKKLRLHFTTDDSDDYISYDMINGIDMILMSYTFFYKNQENFVEPEMFLFFLEFQAQIVLILFLFVVRFQPHC